MKKLLVSAQKELRLLLRDRAGLLVLFVMPALLVLVITLVQDNATRAVGETSMGILLVDNDGTEFGASFSEALSGVSGVVLTTLLNEGRPGRQEALDAVTRGEFAVCIIVPKDMGAAVKQNARRAAEKALSVPASRNEAQDAGAAPALELYFDPALPANFRSAVKNSLRLLILGIETEERFLALGEILPRVLEETLSEKLGPMASAVAAGPALDIALSTEDMDPLMELSEIGSSGNTGDNPNAVQQNVPAWSLFGVFFIVLPMAGGFIKERLYGLDQRLRVLPVSYLTIASGKVLAYVLVCLVQFVLMAAIGTWSLPLFGLPAFEISAPGTAAVVALCAILAATGYGILLGTALRTYEQASVFGPISIVIASAIGGIMVPVWAMPDMLQHISAVSPLCWAQTAFIDLFVRGGDLGAVSGNLLRLLIFAFACILIAWGIEHRRKSA
jgi:ABC-2 type transport system permease protein